MADRSDHDVYAEIVRTVKAEAAKKPPAEQTGDMTLWEIRRRWAAHEKRAFAVPPPAGIVPGPKAEIVTLSAAELQTLTGEPVNHPSTVEPDTPHKSSVGRPQRRW